MTKFTIIGIILLLLMIGCRDNGRPDVSKLLKERKILRLDKDVFALDHENPDIEVLSEKYGTYLDLYVGGVLQLGRVTDPDFKHLFSLFLRDSVMNEVYDSVAVRYADMSIQENELSGALAYYAYYFPGRVIPQVYTHISGFNQSVIVDSAAIGVSLDNYLGENCVFYDMLTTPIPMYARKKMTSRDVVKDALSGWLSAEFPYLPVKNDLISGMIYQGKIIWLLEKLFPDYEKSRLLGYLPEQEIWCENNEKQIWQFLIENDYIFSTQQTLVMKFLSDAPFTSGMPAESPGQAVVWTGYRIIGKYQEKTGVNVEELMKEQDYHKILRISGYRP